MRGEDQRRCGLLGDDTYGQAPTADVTGPFSESQCGVQPHVRFAHQRGRGLLGKAQYQRTGAAHHDRARQPSQVSAGENQTCGLKTDGHRGLAGAPITSARVRLGGGAPPFNPRWRARDIGTRARCRTTASWPAGGMTSTAGGR